MPRPPNANGTSRDECCGSSAMARLSGAASGLRSALRTRRRRPDYRADVMRRSWCEELPEPARQCRRR